jgi:hypothetical protein
MQLREGNGFTRGTIKNWQVTLRHLREYVRLQYKVNDLHFRQLDVQFLMDFDWFARTKWNCRTITKNHQDCNQQRVAEQKPI